MDIWDVEAAKKARGCGARRAAGHCPTLQARGPPLQLRRAAVLPAVALPGDGAPSRRLRRRPSASTAAFRGIWRPTLSGGRPWARAASGWSGGRPTACMRRLLGGLAACDQTMMYSGRECLAPLRPGRSTGPLRVRPTCQCQRRRRRRPSRPPSCRQPLPRVVKEKSTGIEYACKSIAKALDIPNLSGAGCCRRRRRQRRWGPHGAAPGAEPTAARSGVFRRACCCPCALCLQSTSWHSTWTTSSGRSRFLRACVARSGAQAQARDPCVVAEAKRLAPRAAWRCRSAGLGGGGGDPPLACSVPRPAAHLWMQAAGCHLILFPRACLPCPAAWCTSRVPLRMTTTYTWCGVCLPPLPLLLPAAVCSRDQPAARRQRCPPPPFGHRPHHPGPPTE